MELEAFTLQPATYIWVLAQSKTNVCIYTFITGGVQSTEIFASSGSANTLSMAQGNTKKQTSNYTHNKEAIIINNIKVHKSFSFPLISNNIKTSYCLSCIQLNTCYNLVTKQKYFCFVLIKYFFLS